MYSCSIVFESDSLDPEHFTLYFVQGEIKRIALLNKEFFTRLTTCSIYSVFHTLLETMTKLPLTMISLLPENQGMVFSYEGNNEIVYKDTYFQTQDFFFQYLMKNYIKQEKLMEQVEERIKKLKK